MKLAKSLLLGSAAGLFAVAGAQAADLPMRKAAPVEYVRVCSAYGTGFFYIPGTETCLRVSGRVRAEYRYLEPRTRADSASGFRGRGQLNFDARTDTAYGTLRTFIRYEITTQSGSYREGGSILGAGGVTAGYAETTDLNKAFIQFAGVTAGIATSFFDFYANGLNFGGLPTGSDTYGADPVVFAYTASFGGGFSATIAVEDPAARRVQTGVVGQGQPFLYAGQRMPEIVANVRVDQAWGSAQLSGAIHQLQGLNYEGAFVGGAFVPGIGSYVDTEYGFAVQAGAKINMPFLAPGDQLWLQAAYASGAVNYLGLGSSLNQRNIGFATADAAVDALGDVKKTEGYVLTAAFLHYWTPQIRQSVFGSYGKIDNSSSVVALPVGGIYAANALIDAKWWQIGTNVIWSPVAGLDIGVEGIYRVVDPNGRVVDPTRPVPVGTVPFTVGRDDAFEARVRVQRDF